MQNAEFRIQNSEISQGMPCLFPLDLLTVIAFSRKR